MSLHTLGGKPPASFDDPVGVLEQCHRRIRDRLALLGRAAALLHGGVEPGPAREALAHAFAFFEGAGARHNEDEEFSLFPRLAGAAATNALLDELGSEHRVQEAIYLALRTVAQRLLGDAPDDPRLLPELAEHLAAFTASYEDHMRREEAEVFPLARALDAPQLRAVGIEMRLRRGGKEP